MTNEKIWLTLAVIALVTALTRFSPFIFFEGKGKTPQLIQTLGKTLPYAIMGMLVVYCLKSVSFGNVGAWLPSLISVAVVIVTYLWRRNTLAGILAGTICYMILVQRIFI